MTELPSKNIKQSKRFKVIKTVIKLKQKLSSRSMKWLVKINTVKYKTGKVLLI